MAEIAILGSNQSFSAKMYCLQNTFESLIIM